MDLRIRLLLALLSGCVALVAFCLGAEQRSDGQHLSQFATRDTWPLVGTALVFACTAWWWLERTWRRQCLRVQDAERAALARELHDEFGQNLAVMVSAAGFLERHAPTASAHVVADCARDMRTAATQMAQQLRGQLQRLHPQDMQGESLRAALVALADGHWLRAAGVRVHTQWPVVFPALSPQATQALYRTVQEALTNVVRHAGASQVRLACECACEGLRLRIEDDGCGDVQSALRSRRCGMQGMRERAAMADGQFAVSRSELGGLKLMLWLPAMAGGEDIEQPQGDKNHGERAAAG